jgi:hypothetical protein
MKQGPQSSGMEWVPKAQVMREGFTYGHGNIFNFQKKTTSVNPPSTLRIQMILF